jgi:ABC-type multidrug transport system fused ATPase/permease subunit
MLRHALSKNKKINKVLTEAPNVKKDLIYSFLFSFLSETSYVLAPLTAYLATDDIKNRDELIKGSISLVGLLIFGRLLAIPQQKFVTKAATSLGNYVYHRVIDKKWELPLDAQRKGDPKNHLTKMIRENIISTPEYLPNLHGKIYPSIIRQLFASGALMYFNVPAGSSLLGSCFLFHVLSYYLARWSEAPQRGLDMSAFGVYAGMNEAGHAYTLVHSTGGYNEGHQRLNQSTAEYVNSYEANEWRREWISIVSLVFTAVLVGAVGSVTYFSADSTHEFKELILSFAYLMLLQPTFTDLLDSSNKFNRARTSIDSITDFLTTESAVADRLDAKELEIDPAQAKIQFDRVTFIRDGRKVLNNVSFVVEAGKKVVFAGENGAGKSTILRLLMRYDEIDEGAIYINGIDIRNITRRSLLAAFASFPQKSAFFRGSLQDNILFGHHEEQSSSTDFEELTEILHKVGLQEFSGERLYDDIGYDGDTLSGGQKQKVGFARFYLRLQKPNVAICCYDEPEAALDSKAESATNQLINEISSGYTTLLVTHSFASMQDADTIFFLKNGEIIQKGNFEELKNVDGGFSVLLRKYCMLHDKNPDDLMGNPRGIAPRGPKRPFIIVDDTVDGDEYTGDDNAYLLSGIRSRIN